jgi:hypothetical protein
MSSSDETALLFGELGLSPLRKIRPLNSPALQVEEI